VADETLPRSFVTPSAYDVVALAASAGGFGALSTVLGSLDASFPAPIVVVQHLDPRHRSLMAQILGRRTALVVTEAVHDDKIAPGHVFIAPPNHHLLIDRDGKMSLTQTELVHFVRPSADLLFESVAAGFRERSLAVVLSGTGSDGAMGLTAVKKMGGTTIAQDERTAEFFGMPKAAIEAGAIDFVVPLEEIAPALASLMSAGEI
jgi:two-component system, chemotaxis family, protein-glutamate methylesterase/glutaminase